MKYFALLALLVVAPSHASFKVTVLSTDKPDIKKNDVPVDKPVIELASNSAVKENEPVSRQLDKSSSRTIEPLSNENNNSQRDVVLKPDTHHELASKEDNSLETKFGGKKQPVEIMPESETIDSANAAEPMFIADAPKDNRPQNKYEELNAIKKDKRESLITNDVVQINSLVDESVAIKPLFELTQGDTFSGVLEKWGDMERYRVVYDLGVWDRIQELKMTVNYLFTTELKSSVEMFLGLLNNTPNLKANEVTLHACFFNNNYIKVSTNSNCEV